MDVFLLLEFKCTKLNWMHDSGATLTTIFPFCLCDCQKTITVNVINSVVEFLVIVTSWGRQRLLVSRCFS